MQPFSTEHGLEMAQQHIFKPHYLSPWWSSTEMPLSQHRGLLHAFHLTRDFSRLAQDSYFCLFLCLLSRSNRTESQYLCLKIPLRVLALLQSALGCYHEILNLAQDSWTNSQLIFSTFQQTNGMEDTGITILLSFWKIHPRNLKFLVKV